MSVIGNRMFDGNMVKGRIEAAKESLKGLNADESGESYFSDTVLVSTRNGTMTGMIGGFAGGIFGGIAGVSSVIDQANLANHGVGTNPTIGEALGTMAKGIGGGIGIGVAGGFALGAIGTAIVVSLS